MKWETRQAEPRPYYVLENGPVRLSVSDAEGNSSVRWQYCTITVCGHTPASRDSCLRSWPREALTKARLALDEFEGRLNAV